MVDMTYQWLFVVMDTSSEDDMPSFIQLGQDGFNIAFAFQTSQAWGSAACRSGLQCMVADLVSNMAASWENTLVREMVESSKVSHGAWMVIKPSHLERLSQVKTELGRLLWTTSQCNKCSIWRLEVR